MDNIKLGKKLTNLRGNRTQREIADLLGISTSTYAMYEIGQRRPGDDMKVKIANLYKKSIKSIFFED